MVLTAPLTTMRAKRAFLALACVFFALCGCGAPKASEPVQEPVAGAVDTVALIRASLEANRKERDRPGELMDLIRLGKALSASGEHKEAPDELARAIKLAVKLQDPKGLADAHGAMSEARLGAGDTVAALESIEKAFEIDSKLAVVSQARLNLKGLILIRSGRPAEALVVLKSSLAIKGDRELLSDAMRLSGVASRQTGDDAAWFFGEAYRLDRELGRTGMVALDLRELAELNFEKGRHDEALFLFERSYAAYLEAGAFDMALKGLDRLIDAANGLGRPEKAGYYSGLREELLRNTSVGGAAR